MWREKEKEKEKDLRLVEERKTRTRASTLGCNETDEWEITKQKLIIARREREKQMERDENGARWSSASTSVIVWGKERGTKVRRRRGCVEKEVGETHSRGTV